MAFLKKMSKKKEPQPAVPASSTKAQMPMWDEVEALGNSVMAKVERWVVENLEKNPVFTCTRMVAVLYHMGRDVLGDSDPDVQRLRLLLSDPEQPILREALNNQDQLKRRAVTPGDL